ncbi:MAG: Sensor protein [uncultured bacterium]|nr:MAG: Sensor protein [uncultured bacterium]OGH14005.1 MAG: hypothetical protein A2687_06080 [Candidatus Levybacteria bacterium RIFCSPHIGHO2_01_FULL_38_26]
MRKILVLFLLYVTTAIFGLNIEAVGGFATLVWPPAGISLAFLLLFGYQLWPGVWMGAFFANVLRGAPESVAFGVATGNTLEAVLGVFILTHFIKGFNYSLSRLSDVLGLLLVATVSTLVGASVGVSSLLLGGIISFSSSAQTFLAWWVGDALGDLIIAPLILVWSVPGAFRIPKSRLLEAILSIQLLFISGVVVFNGAFGLDTRNLPFTYLIYPVLVFIAIRFGQRGIVASMFILIIIAIWNTLEGYGPFAKESIFVSLLLLQFFMGVASVTFMILASFVSERKDIEARKDEFVSIASHELKTPITSMKIFTQTLKRWLTLTDDKKSVRLLTRIDDKLNLLTKIVNDLLDVSRVRVGTLPLHKKVFDYDSMIKEAVEDIQMVSKNHNIILRGRIKRKILGDPDRLNQVLVNLLTNAVKYSPSSDRVIVRTFSDEEKLTVGVQDFGIGIAEDEQKYLFTPFYRIKGARGERFFGLGIGLNIAKELVRQHGGKLWVESKKGKGSTFYFTLPFR